MPHDPQTQQRLVHKLVMGRKQGLSNRKLARKHRISRNRVRKLLADFDKSRREESLPPPPKPVRTRSSILEPYLDSFNALLARYPDITGVRMLEELQTLGYPGGIAVVRRKLKALRPQKSRNVVVRMEVVPGQQGQMDWSPYRIRFRDGTRVQVQCFSYVLSFSRRLFVDFALKRNLHTLLRRHIDAFEYFNGVPHECLYDNEKTIVLRWEAGQPLFHPTFLQFITHYLCRPIACRPRRPQTKGRVEKYFQFIERNLLNAHTFHNLDDLRRFTRWWLRNRADTRIHSATGRTPIDLFETQEVPSLLPLPEHRFDAAELMYLMGRIDGYVQFKHNFYSIPYDNVGQILTLRATEHEVCLFAPDLQPLGRHPRLPDGARQRTELPEHRPARTALRYGLEPVRSNFLTLGEAAEAFLEGLTQRCPRNPGYHARRILSLRESYHSDDIHRALIHATRFHAFDAPSIERILKARAQRRTLEQLAGSRQSARLRKTLPQVTQRPLTDYDQAFSDSLAPRQAVSDSSAADPSPSEGDGCAQTTPPRAQ